MSLQLTLLIAGLLVGLGNAPFAHGHGDPEKVVDGRMSVALALAPADHGTHLRFRFGDTRTGQLLTVPITMRLAVRDPATGGLTAVRPGLRVLGGVINLNHVFPSSGPQEVLIEFERGDEPGRMHQPEDWLVVPPGGPGSLTWTGVAGLAGVLGALAAPLLYLRFRDRPHGPSTTAEPA